MHQVEVKRLDERETKEEHLAEKTGPKEIVLLIVIVTVLGRRKHGYVNKCEIDLKVKYRPLYRVVIQPFSSKN